MRTLAFVSLALLTVYAPGAASQEAPNAYPSDVPGSGYQWLEREQRAAGKGYCPAITEQQALARQMSWLFPDLDKIYQLPEFKALSFPTRCEEGPTYLVVNSIAAEIRSAAESLTGQAVPKINWGTLPVFEVTASAQQIGSDYMVVVNRQLVQFSYNLLLDADRTLQIEPRRGNLRFYYDEEGFERALRVHRGLTSEFAYLVTAFISGNPVLGPARAGPLERPLVERQLRKIQRFYVGHEFGHVLRGHTERGVRMIGVRLIDGSVRRLPSLGRDWLQELQADVSGEELSSEAGKNDKPAGDDWEPIFAVLQEYAPALLLILFDALEDVNYCDGSGVGSAISVSEKDQQRNEDWAFGLLEAGQDMVVPDVDATLLGCRQNSHLPAWLRSRLSRRRADMKMARMGIKDDARIDMAKALIRNVERLAALSAEEIRRRLARQVAPAKSSGPQ
jgi:hypothetical protein